MQLLLLLAIAGCATPKTEPYKPNPDPMESTNRLVFNSNERLDQYIMRPIAETYVDITSPVVRQTVTNFFDNLTYVNVIANDFLQGKFEQGVNDSLRLVFNTTLGIGGLFDVAGQDMGLAKNDEDFGQTLAVWGVDKGMYLYLPLLGPNTARDSADLLASALLNPLFYVSAPLSLVSTLNSINTRADLLDASTIRDEAAIDPYTFTREAYLQKRQYLQYDGNAPNLMQEDDIFDDFDEASGVLTIE